MATEVTINNIYNGTYPVDVYVCVDCNNTSCSQVTTINGVPSVIPIPSPYNTLSSFAVQIVDNNDCSYCQTFNVDTTTTTTTINPLCFTCDIGFDFYDTNPISEISVGVVTASCDPSLTDYVIDWYGPGIGSSTVAFTSGLGNDYSGDYTFTHPLTGATAIPVIAGVYTPIIRIIKLNGVEYQDLNCFGTTTVDVDALTCVNGSPTNYPQYSHKLSYQADLNVIPPPFLSTFALDPTKPYFAFRFLGYSIYDTVKITFFGSDYTEPIVLEYIQIGFNVTSTDMNYNITPKAIKPFYSPNNYFSKVLTLTGLTINVGDYLELEIIPNEFNTNTNWEFYCECLESFDCSLCDDTNTLPPYKIIQSTITQGLPTVCGKINLSFNLSGCDESDIYRYMLTDAANWSGTGYGDRFYGTANSVVTLGGMSSTPQTICSRPYIGSNSTCSVPTTSTITYSKTVPTTEGLLTITFSDLNDLWVYYYNWQNIYSSYSGSTDCNDVDFYRYFILRIPLASGAQNCGDDTGYQDYLIHPTAVVTTGGTGPYTMTITMPTVTNCLDFADCDENCDFFLNLTVDEINESSTGITNNLSITSLTGSRLLLPISLIVYVTLNTVNLNEAIYYGEMKIPKYVNETIPYSGTPLTLIPSLSGKTCEFNDWHYSTFYSSEGGTYYVNQSFLYKVIRPNPLNVEDFEIWTSTLINGVYNGYPGVPVTFKIYEYISGVPNVIDPSYFV